MRKCENTKIYICEWYKRELTYRYTRKSTSMNSMKGTHEFAKRKLERHTGGLEGWSTERSTGVHATAAPL